jgi:hypothetical protein
MPKYLSRTIQQIPLEQMKRGLARPVATLRFEPAEITSRSGLTFETAHDDLDELQAAVFRDATGQEFALVRHLRQPTPGTDILINEKSRDLGAALRDALHGLQFEPRELRWTHPKIEVAKLKRSSDVRHKAAEIRKKIERLEVKLEQVLRVEKMPKELTYKASAAVRPAIREHGRGRRSASFSEQLGPAVVHLLKSHGKPLSVSDIFAKLVDNGYKFDSLQAKKSLLAKICRLKGVRQVGPGRFAAD